MHLDHVLLVGCSIGQKTPPPLPLIQVGLVCVSQYLWLYFCKMGGMGFYLLSSFMDSNSFVQL